MITTELRTIRLADSGKPTSFRLEPTEWGALEAQAAERGLSLPEWVKVLIKAEQESRAIDTLRNAANGKLPSSRVLDVILAHGLHKNPDGYGFTLKANWMNPAIKECVVAGKQIPYITAFTTQAGKYRVCQIEPTEAMSMAVILVEALAGLVQLNPELRGEFAETKAKLDSILNKPERTRTSTVIQSGSEGK